MIAPVMKHKASPSSGCLPVLTDVVVVLRGFSRRSLSDNLPIVQECLVEIEVVVDDRGLPASDDYVVLLVTTVLD